MTRLLKAAFSLTAIFFFALLPRSGKAMVLPFLEMEELTDISDLIVQAEVIAVESRWDEAHRSIRTDVTLQVQSVLLGSFDGEKLRIELPGGSVPGEDWRQVIPGLPTFAVGEEAVVFLRKDPGLFCPIAGWIQGKFDVITEPESGRKLVLDRFGKYRRYLKRKAGIHKLKALGDVEKVGVEEFAAVIAEIQGGKGSRR